MNSEEYLHTLQSNLPTVGLNTNDLSSTTTHLLQSRDRVVSLLTDKEKTTLPDIAFGVLPTLDPNAWAIRAPGGGAVICIDMLLPTALWVVSRALGEHIRAAVEFNEVHDPIADTLRPLGLVAGWFLTRDQKYASQLNGWKGSLKPLAYPIDRFVGGFDNYQLDFIIMHEIQHILQGHIGRNHQSYLTSTSDDNHKIEVKKITQNIQQEFDADRGATIAFCRDQQLVDTGAFFLCEVVFLFLQTVELFSVDQIRENTHPNSFRRLTAIQSIYDDVSGGMKGIGAGFRKNLSFLFETNQKMFEGISTDFWLDPTNSENLRMKYIDSVLKGTIATHVTFGGEITDHEVNSISTTANTWYQEDLVHSGLTKSSNSFLTEVSMLGGFIGGLAALASFLTQLYRSRKREQETNNWHADRIRELINEELNNRNIDSCVCSNLFYFNKSVIEDGDLFVVELENMNEALKIFAKVGALSTGISVSIYRHLPPPT